MARAKWKKSPNADLVKAVQDHTDQIIKFYERVEDERPVILLDLQKQTICAYHYEEYKVRLSKESQVVLDVEYEKALADWYKVMQQIGGDWYAGVRSLLRHQRLSHVRLKAS